MSNPKAILSSWIMKVIQDLQEVETQFIYQMRTQIMQSKWFYGICISYWLNFICLLNHFIRSIILKNIRGNRHTQKKRICLFLKKILHLSGCSFDEAIFLFNALNAVLLWWEIVHHNEVWLWIQCARILLNYLLLLGWWTLKGDLSPHKLVFTWLGMWLRPRSIVGDVQLCSF